MMTFLLMLTGLATAEPNLIREHKGHEIEDFMVNMVDVRFIDADRCGKFARRIGKPGRLPHTVEQLNSLRSTVMSEGILCDRAFSVGVRKGVHTLTCLYAPQTDQSTYVCENMELDFRTWNPYFSAWRQQPGKANKPARFIATDTLEATDIK
jgi:hypothetical protein